MSLEAYTVRVKAQSLPSQAITPDALRRVLAHLVLSEALLNQLGPAVASGRAIFLFGNTGNGKTSIGEAVGVLPPGAIWIPYVVSVNEQIIKVFDPTHHQLISTTAETEKRSGALRYLSSQSEEYDQRWALIERPFIAVGGELTMKNLNLVYDPTTKDYQAPYQMKANGGIFLLDDFGRQRVQPRNLLNRWIVPLEKGEDYLTLETGQKINVPFDVLVIFATNLVPEDLVDEAYLRRIRYKIYVPDPTLEEFREIFRREAAKRDISYSEEGWRYLIAEYYTKPKRTPRGVHPRDILDELVDIARFQRHPAHALPGIAGSGLPCVLSAKNGRRLTASSVRRQTQKDSIPDIPWGGIFLMLSAGDARCIYLTFTVTLCGFADSAFGRTISRMPSA